MHARIAQLALAEAYKDYQTRKKFTPKGLGEETGVRSTAYWLGKLEAAAKKLDALNPYPLKGTPTTLAEWAKVCDLWIPVQEVQAHPEILQEKRTLCVYPHHRRHGSMCGIDGVLDAGWEEETAEGGTLTVIKILGVRENSGMVGLHNLFWKDFYAQNGNARGGFIHLRY
jgi:hypothetical protein